MQVSASVLRLVPLIYPFHADILVSWVRAGDHAGLLSETFRMAAAFAAITFGPVPTRQ